jgi:purine-cytosine permease-like protein
MEDTEANQVPGPKDASRLEMSSLSDGQQTSQEHRKGPALYHRVVDLLGVEVHGNDPVEPEAQTDRRYLKLFTLWFSMNFNLIAYDASQFPDPTVLFDTDHKHNSVSTGFSGTYAYGLGLRDCALVIVFFALLTACAPAFLCTFGSKLGLRQMIVARYSFG